ncbi:glutaminase A [Legionella bononiensis]|uniref:Glutaminase n=1 Tax=Legionella bononiensis TaxID=2793102 RepID=A0ABS1W746_9GAMM|nr:glutaminase A [Legionella bononiensis]MBL7481292.1 glutaminase A [Legionella bononiensis]MBL7525196.1 glutaminase A [Legionella bononiensis]MBL7561379.1 glutaminase A [Legionella bononiensis]
MTENLLTINLLKELVESAELNQAGNTASYIPELANVNQELTALAVQQLGEQPISWSNAELKPVTLQSTSKLIPLIGLLEEVGAEQLFEWVKVEPSGDDFASITRLEQFGPKPSNPMLNAGAITLCSHIPGTGEHQFGWLEHWVKKLFNEKLSINPLVYASEKRTGDRNRSLAYLLKSRNNLGADVNETLDLYFALCSYEATLEQMLYLPLLLANGGTDPVTHEPIISQETCKITLAIMATCGLYDETGTHMVKTGIPAKSGVSGYIIGTVPGKAGIVALSPRVNAKGNSIRGELMLEGLSKAMNWHFALPG